MCVYMCVYACIYICTYIHAYTYIHMYIHIYKLYIIYIISVKTMSLIIRNLYCQRLEISFPSKRHLFGFNDPKIVLRIESHLLHLTIP